MYDNLSFPYSLIKCYVQSSQGFSYLVYAVTCESFIEIQMVYLSNNFLDSYPQHNLYF